MVSRIEHEDRRHDQVEFLHISENPHSGGIPLHRHHDSEIQQQRVHEDVPEQRPGSIEIQPQSFQEHAGDEYGRDHVDEDVEIIRGEVLNDLSAECPVHGLPIRSFSVA